MQPHRVGLPGGRRAGRRQAGPVGVECAGEDDGRGHFHREAHPPRRVRVRPTCLQGRRGASHRGADGRRHARVRAAWAVHGAHLRAGSRRVPRAACEWGHRQVTDDSGRTHQHRDQGHPPPRLSDWSASLTAHQHPRTNIHTAHLHTPSTHPIHAPHPRAHIHAPHARTPCTHPHPCTPSTHPHARTSSTRPIHAPQPRTPATHASCTPTRSSTARLSAPLHALEWYHLSRAWAGRRLEGVHTPKVIRAGCTASPAAFARKAAFEAHTHTASYIGSRGLQAPGLSFRAIEPSHDARARGRGSHIGHRSAPSPQSTQSHTCTRLRLPPKREGPEAP
mmetsp:Transcript_8788/g.19538  ORF Transcript_8788/g.19538 Transcript_8788/m.19538 type:complete len:335 (+) Transcript_8788:701-1705(+)